MGLPTTEECIEDEERRIGIKIPSIIKSMIMINNGGAECVAKDYTDEIWNLFAVKDMRSREHIRRSSNHIERESLSAAEWAGFPRGAVAIGSNGCGDYLIVKKNSDETYIWRHETGETLEAFIEPFI